MTSKEASPLRRQEGSQRRIRPARKNGFELGKAMWASRRVGAFAPAIYEELACPGKKEGAQPTLTRAMTIPTKVQACNLPRAITISDMDHRGGT
jgi:hypothetical protein